VNSKHSPKKKRKKKDKKKEKKKKSQEKVSKKMSPVPNAEVAQVHRSILSYGILR